MLAAFFLLARPFGLYGSFSHLLGVTEMAANRGSTSSFPGNQLTSLTLLQA
jgi:hypothetical protein